MKTMHVRMDVPKKTKLKAERTSYMCTCCVAKKAHDESTFKLTHDFSLLAPSPQSSAAYQQVPAADHAGDDART